MPLRVSSNNKGTWITWETPDESLSATFRIKPEMSEEEILKTLVKAVIFIGNQMGIMATEIAELELAIMGSVPGTPSTMTTTTGTTLSTARPASAATGSAPVDPNAQRVPMMPPASLSDLPNGGVPITTFGWGSMPTTSVPAELAAPEAGGWEMIPPGELE